MADIETSAPTDDGLGAALAAGEIWSATAGVTHDELVVFVHGYATRPRSYAGLLERFHEAGRDVFAPSYDARPFSTAEPAEVAGALAKQIATRVAGYSRVLLCAHSMGCVFLRDALVSAVEDGADDSLAPLAKAMSEHRARVLLLASTNRGFHATGWPRIGLEALHRWFWGTLLVILWGAWIRGFAPLWAVVGAVATTTLGAAVVALFAWQRSFAWRGFVWTAMAVAWAWWGAVGANLPAWVMMAVTAVGTLAFATLIGFRIGPAIGLSTLGAIAAAVPRLVEPDIAWVWPATLGVVLTFILYPWKSGLLIENVLFGSPWIARVRLRWLAKLKDANLDVVHAFGENDRLVDEDDQIELLAASDSAEFSVEGGTHLDFTLTPRDRKASDSARYGPIREFLSAYLENRLSGPLPRGWRNVRCTPRAEASSAENGSPNDQGEHVVLLVHGIRDFGEWQDVLKVRVERYAERHGWNLVETVVVRYGYFTAFQFLLSGERDRATRTFVDAYAQARARHPNARFHVAAHSNGTYVVCNALQSDASVELDNVYLAGSVVSPRYDWARVAKGSPTDRAGSIRGAVRSDCATTDWPVGVLCWILSGFGLLNRLTPGLPWGRLGAGGVDGFSRGTLDAHRCVTETKHLRGGHGEAIRAAHHDGIAKFLLTGAPGSLPSEAPVDRRFRYGVTAGVLAGVALVAVLFAATIAWAPSTAWAALVGALLTLVVVRVAMAV